MMHRILHHKINTIVKRELIVLRFRSTPWSFLFCKISIPSNFHRFFFFRNVLNPLYKICWRKLSKKDFCSFFGNTCCCCHQSHSPFVCCHQCIWFSMTVIQMNQFQVFSTPVDCHGVTNDTQKSQIHACFWVSLWRCHVF